MKSNNPADISRRASIVLVSFCCCVVVVVIVLGEKGGVCACL